MLDGGRTARRGKLIVFCGVSLMMGSWYGVAFAAPAPDTYVGSASCTECHERFHELWSTSRHGLALQPYTNQLAAANLTEQTADIQIGAARYRAHVGQGEGYVRETTDEGERDYRMLYAMGGKNVYYFLTALDKGRLQTLPVAYDVNTKEWYDMAGSGVRHFTDRTDSPYQWTDPPYTFNTSCHACHVSQLSTNYDLQTNTYATTWNEPGINCETCHDPANEHVRVCREAPKGTTPEDLKIKLISQKRGYTADEVSANCSGCHAKMSPITPKYEVGDEFYNHYDLTTLEHPDFYPDGRDLGENYTYTTWRMSPCVKAGELDCMHCHTSSGRYRFSEPERANSACLPCHESRVNDAEAHTHHKPGEDSPKCVSCHMPTTRFAAMMRSDHSMRPPMPASSLAFESPNACNLCHTDKDAAWADRYVREWHEDDYQAKPVRIARLVDSARKREWMHLEDMLAYLQDPEHDEIIANSLVRLLRACPDPRKWPVLRSVVAKAPSPLVRGSGAEALGDGLTSDIVGDLVHATRDPYGLVRVRAAAALAPVPLDMLEANDRSAVEAALSENMAALTARPDDWASHYNLGNFYASRREFRKAVQSFDTATRLRPDAVAPYVNVSLVYNALGENDKAESSLRKAIAMNPDNSAAHLNLGMLLGELGRTEEAADAFKTALDKDPQSAAAAYNLGVITAQTDPSAAIPLCRKAYELRPDEPKYAYTLAFYLNQSGDAEGAVAVLEKLCKEDRPFPDAYSFLGKIYEGRGDLAKAYDVYRRAADNGALSTEARDYFRMRIESTSAE